MRAKRERLEAWKKDREAKKALEEAKAKAQALALAKAAGANPPGEYSFFPSAPRSRYTKPLDPPLF